MCDHPCYKVETTLDKLFDNILAADLVVFKDMFSIGGTTNNPKGLTDEDPIHLCGLRVHTWDMFIEHQLGRQGAYCVYKQKLIEYRPHASNRYTIKDLEEFLGFCVKYQCVETLECL
jgi:hypothetical protein